MLQNNDYQPGASGGGSSVPADSGPSLGQLKRDYLAYLESKREEIDEQQQARRYYHGSQYTDAQIKALNGRKQPVVTYNRIARKINGMIGLLEQQRTDPRAFPRTPQEEEGAEIATAAIRYALDQSQWADLSSNAGACGAVDGIGVCELIIMQGDAGDNEVEVAEADAASFFYDPRSLRPDFSDARYMGLGKWMDLDAAIEMFPDKAEDLRASSESGYDLTSNPDSDSKWFAGSEHKRRVRVVDHWYLRGGDWHYCIYTGALKLAAGKSYLRDEKGKTACKYIAFSAFVDQDGDRYGFVRGMKSSQDEINQRRSKALHTLNVRRIIAEKSAFDDVEEARRQAIRPDGIIIKNPGTHAEFDDASRAQEINGHMAFLEDAKAEIENYGFNPALVGTGVQDMSGRAIQLQQRAGMAEIGPFLTAFKGWKIRVYRAVWSAIRQYWTAERWIRVTDDDNVARFLGINQLTVDPRTGMPVVANKLAALDVDIIIDEGPDTINMQADTFDTLSIMARNGNQIPPEILIEMSPLVGTVKKKLLGILQQARQADPMIEQAKQIELAQNAAKVDETQANTQLKMAQAAKAATEAQLKPLEMAQDAQEAALSRDERFAMKRADMASQERQKATQAA